MSGGGGTEARLARGTSGVETYHHIMDVVCLLQSHFLIFFAFSTFMFCKHNARRAVSVSGPEHLSGPLATQPAAASATAHLLTAQQLIPRGPSRVLRWSRAASGSGDIYLPQCPPRGPSTWCSARVGDPRCGAGEAALG